MKLMSNECYRRAGPRMRSKDPLLCDHANENPVVCKCPSDCYCKTHTCKPPRNINRSIKRQIEALDIRIHHCAEQMEWWHQRMMELEKEMWTLRQQEESKAGDSPGAEAGPGTTPPARQKEEPK